MTRKLPALTVDTAPFWQGGASGTLLIHYCSACKRLFHPPAPICPHCTSFEVGPRAVSGLAKVITFTVNRQAWTPDLAQPYVVAIVQLAEQEDLTFLTNIVNCPVEEVAIGMAVRVSFLQCEDVWIPLFERAD